MSNNSTVKVIKKLLPLLKLYPKKMIIIIILGILSSFFEGLGISLFIPLLQSVIQTSSSVANSNFFVDILNRIFINVSPNNRFLIIASCILSSIVLKNCLSYSNSILFAWVNARIGYQLRSRIFQQFLSVSYSFLENNESGKLINTLASETWRTTQALSIVIGLIIAISTVIVYTILLLMISWQLTLLVSILLMLTSFIIGLATHQVKHIGKQSVAANSALAKRMWEGYGGMKVIRSFGRESYEQQRFDAASNKVVSSFLKLDIVSGIVQPISEVLSAVILLFILVITLLQDQNSLPSLLTFIFILYRLQPRVQHLDSARVGLLALASAIDEVMSLLDCSNKPYIRSGRISFKSLEQGIYFESVSFRYNPQDKPALQNISICIPRGKTTAIVGPSGAGKSTLISLLCRFYDMSSGEIYVDSYPL